MLMHVKFSEGQTFNFYNIYIYYAGLQPGISPISQTRPTGSKPGPKAKKVPAEPVRARSTRQASLQANKNFTNFTTCQECGETFKTVKQFERHVAQNHYGY